MCGLGFGSGSGYCDALPNLYTCLSLCLESRRRAPNKIIMDYVDGGKERVSEVEESVDGGKAAVLVPTS